METSQIHTLPNDYNSDQKSNPGSTRPEIYNSNIQLETSEIPSRDLEMNKANVTQVPQTKVNFVPESENDIYYIPDYKKSEAVTNGGVFESINSVSVNDLKIPILVAMLFVVFNLPVARNAFMKFYSSGFNEKNELNSQGLYVLGMFFGLAYFTLTTIINSYNLL
jgi:hypothetical protein